MVLLTGDVPHEADGETVAAVTAGIEGEADAHNEMPGVSGGGFGSIIAANLRKDTVNGARALDLETGEVREGAIADLSIVDIDNSWFLSPGSFLANLIYTAHSDVISSVIAAGRFVMRDRVVDGEQEILAEARKVLSQIR